MTVGKEGGQLKCENCRTAFFICVSCYRYNHYCSETCRKFRRDKSRNSASKRYSKSAAGKKRCAERVRRYRIRKKNVTHHTTIAISENIKDAQHFLEVKPIQSSSKDQLPEVHQLCMKCAQKLSRILRNLNSRSLRRDYQRRNHRNSSSPP